MSNIKFVNKKTSQVFLGDPPFVHWFEEGPMSTDLYHYTNILFISDESDVTVSIPESPSPKFFILKPYNSTDTETIDWETFMNIEDELSYSITLTGNELSDGSYVYGICFIAKSDTEGEFRESFYIGDDEFRLGGEFYGENEVLKINLANHGIEYPDAICKAIYPCDIYEDHKDNVLMNRKWRELLSGYMETIGCKGSYKSLINSLGWFEYGDLVELKEVWKHETPDGIKYEEHELNDWVTDLVRSQCTTISKTTYYTLRHLSYTIDRESHTSSTPWTYKTDADRNPTISNSLKECCVKWGREEMRLKMVLLGNFFETYFMPIHLDLIRSVVEDLYLGSPILIETASVSEEENLCFTYQQDPESFVISGNDYVQKNSDDGYYEFRLNEVSVFGYVPPQDVDDVVYDNDEEILLFSSASDSEYNLIVGCVNQAEVVEDDDSYLSMFFSQNYNGIGSVIKITTSFSEEIVSCKLYTNITGTSQVLKTGDGKAILSDSDNSLNFNILAYLDGEFYLTFVFVGKSGTEYSKSINIRILDNITPDVVFYTLNYVGRTDSTPSVSPIDNMFIRTRLASEIFDGTMDWEDTTDDNGDNVVYLSDTNKIRIRKDFTYSQFISGDITLSHSILFYGYSSGFGSYSDDEISDAINEYLNCDVFVVRDESDNISKVICIWSSDIAKSSSLISSIESYFEGYIERDIFEPRYYQLNEIDPETNYEIPRGTPMVCVPCILLQDSDGNIVKQKYSHYLKMGSGSSESMWNIYSYGKQQNILNTDHSIKEPLVYPTYREPLPLGSYKITYSWKYGSDVHSVIKKCPFVIVDE